MIPPIGLKQAFVHHLRKRRVRKPGLDQLRLAEAVRSAIWCLGGTRCSGSAARTTSGSPALRLARTFATQLEALKRYRTGGTQKVTVEHVTVNAGGQAIVGNVAHGGRGEDEN